VISGGAPKEPGEYPVIASVVALHTADTNEDNNTIGRQLSVAR
jgi:hypothetical protein